MLQLTFFFKSSMNIILKKDLQSGLLSIYVNILVDISKICHRKLVEFLDPVVIYTSLRNVSGLLHKLTHIKMHTGEFMAGMEML